MRLVVVLPAPLGPSNVWNSLGLTFRSSLSAAGRL
jgi:hypothetical protein